MFIGELSQFLQNMKLTEQQELIGSQILKEIRARVGNGGQNSIPASDDAKVYFYAWSTTDNGKYRSGEMIKAKSHEKDGQTWNDVWYVRIPEVTLINQPHSFPVAHAL